MREASARPPGDEDARSRSADPVHAEAERPSRADVEPQLPPRVALIAAMARDRVIGAGNRMPWHLPADLKRFRALTTGHRVVMGRRTFESLGRALPGRENVVVTRNAHFGAEGCIVAGSFAAALADLALPPPVFCIGGAELFKEALPYATEIFLTEIDAEYAGDVRMPEIPPGEFREDAREHAIDAERGLGFSFVHLTRVGAPRLHYETQP